MNTIIIFVLAFIFMAILPVVLSFALKNHQTALKITTIVLSCIYFVALFIGTTCDISISLNKTTIEFDYTHSWFTIDFLVYDFDLDNILINVFMFFPLGFIVYTFAKTKHFSKTIILALILSLCIELIQFVLPIHRYTELTDILFNTLSGLISAFACKLLSSKGAFKKSK